MKTEKEIRDFINYPHKWGMPFIEENTWLPAGVVIWYIKYLLLRRVLGEIPDHINGYYCYTHERAYLAEEGRGCDLCEGHGEHYLIA